MYMYSSLYQASNRRKLTPPEIDKYEEEQYRIIRDKKGQNEKLEIRTRDEDHAVVRDEGGGGGRPDRVGRGVGAQRDVVLECVVCFEKSNNAVFAPCGHRFVFVFTFFFQRRSVRNK
jgi:hypothetical protein